MNEILVYKNIMTFGMQLSKTYKSSVLVGFLQKHLYMQQLRLNLSYSLG